MKKKTGTRESQHEARSTRGITTREGFAWGSARVRLGGNSFH
jgi:hypothetical protein